MSRKMKRTEERELALRGIFQLDFHLEDTERNESLDAFMALAGQSDSEDEIKGESGGYARSIIDTVVAHQAEIDTLIRENLKDTWQLERLPKAEKAILRMGIAELLFAKDLVPKEIAINEAVELAKNYGSDDGPNYVNGILNHIATDKGLGDHIDGKKHE